MSYFATMNSTTIEPSYTLSKWLFFVAQTEYCSLFSQKERDYWQTKKRASGRIIYVRNILGSNTIWLMRNKNFMLRLSSFFFAVLLNEFVSALATFPPPNQHYLRYWRFKNELLDFLNAFSWIAYSTMIYFQNINKSLESQSVFVHLFCSISRFNAFMCFICLHNVAFIKTAIAELLPR